MLLLLLLLMDRAAAAARCCAVLQTTEQPRLLLLLLLLVSYSSCSCSGYPRKSKKAGDLLPATKARFSELEQKLVFVLVGVLVLLLLLWEFQKVNGGTVGLLPAAVVDFWSITQGHAVCQGTG